MGKVLFANTSLKTLCSFANKIGHEFVIAEHIVPFDRANGKQKEEIQRQVSARKDQEDNAEG